ncbi:MAG: hypothetical protein A2Y62_12235 [Candidatus Fischerbacteria bacterium RBG_13_37_8]|uniref:3-oxoacyl-ACP reductase n=1 Tax=Candidatus Fischerbacteria bacterium RBG_13_37_8 TaxID=1817863 RepID=A0A1F5VDI0_9BACT|nr:MAG: hypothetical protein A2Y62_12235 [Candidatus Fischerbacteria bacterium RBG_13_37_8]
MDLGLKDKIAMVAASSKGLGKAIAHELALEGCKIAICSRDTAALQKSAEEIERHSGGSVFYRTCDVKDRQQVAQFINELTTHFTGIDIAIINAGGPRSGTFADVTYEDWEEAVKLTLLSAVSICQCVIPHMMKKQWGRIIFVTSVSVKQPIENLILSNSIRLAVIGLCKSLSNEYAKHGILVNAVCPGYTKTERLEELAKNLSRTKEKDVEAIYQDWSSNVPMKRLGKPEELARLVAFLASERASYITGTAIQVDGGLVKFIY